MSQVEYTENFEISQPVAVLFPLFSAEGEKYWVPGWDYKNVMGTTELHEDYVFLTGGHDHADSDAIWLVKKYQPDSYYVEFYRVEPQEKVGVVKVECRPVSASQTRVSVTYKYIALSESGREFVASFTGVNYREFIGKWKQLLEEYFASSC